MSVMLHSGTVLATRAYTARPVPQQQQRLNTLFRRKVALLAYKESAPAVLESSGDVWTDHSTPQQKKAKLRAPSGPQIPKFLVKQTDYNPHDYVEVGFVWKAIGARGEVLVRVCTSLQDYRVGLAGPRCDRNCIWMFLALSCHPVLKALPTAKGFFFHMFPCSMLYDFCSYVVYLGSCSITQSCGIRIE